MARRLDDSMTEREIELYNRWLESVWESNLSYEIGVEIIEDVDADGNSTKELKIPINFTNDKEVRSSSNTEIKNIRYYRYDFIFKCKVEYYDNNEWCEITCKPPRSFFYKSWMIIFTSDNPRLRLYLNTQNSSDAFNELIEIEEELECIRYELTKEKFFIIDISEAVDIEINDLEKWFLSIKPYIKISKIIMPEYLENFTSFSMSINILMTYGRCILDFHNCYNLENVVDFCSLLTYGKYYDTMKISEIDWIKVVQLFNLKCINYEHDEIKYTATLYCLKDMFLHIFGIDDIKLFDDKEFMLSVYDEYTLKGASMFIDEFLWKADYLDYESVEVNFPMHFPNIPPGITNKEAFCLFFEWMYLEIHQRPYPKFGDNLRFKLKCSF